MGRRYVPFQTGSGAGSAIAVISVLVVLTFAALSTAVVLVRGGSERYVSGPGPYLDSAVPIRQPCAKGWGPFYTFFGRM